MKIGAAAAVALSLAACGGSGELDDRSSAAVYANVIWALVEQNDASSPAAPVFVERGGLTAEQQRVIERMLADLPTLDFVADGRSVLIDTGCPQVREDGVPSSRSDRSREALNG